VESANIICGKILFVELAYRRKFYCNLQDFIGNRKKMGIAGDISTLLCECNMSLRYVNIQRYRYIGKLYTFDFLWILMLYAIFWVTALNSRKSLKPMLNQAY